jgi:hypothetical protein
MHFKQTSPYVLSMLFASCNTIELKHHNKGRGHVHDIAENDVDPWVYDKVSSAVEYEAYRGRAEEPAVNNYWDNDAPKSAGSHYNIPSPSLAQ